MEESRQLLVVSDNDQFKKWTAFPLERGCGLLHAENVTDGIARWGSACAAVILDLPEITSEYISQLRALYPRLQLIAVVSTNDSEAILNCFRAGCFDVLVRPVSEEQFSKMLNRLLQLQSIYPEKFAYRAELEKANRELKDSLKILEMDQMAGRQVQLSMLPEKKWQTGEYEIAYSIIPSLYLSGDFVGYHIVFDRYLLFYLADVSGHGASSAFITILLRFLLGRIIRRHINNDDREALSRAPEGFLEHVNRQLLDLNIDKHLTIFSASIDMQNNILRYSVGAHMPTPIFMAGGDARFLPGKGKPLGIFEDVTWEVQEIALPEKFVMTATSDGVLEFISGDSLSDKFTTMIHAVAESDGSLESICDKLGINDVEDAPDDVTVLTVRRGF